MLDDGIALRKVVRPPKKCLNFGYENGLLERLGYKIIRPHIHGHYDVHVVSCRRNKNDRHLGNLTDLAAPVIPVKERKRDIQQHNMRLKLRKFL